MRFRRNLGKNLFMPQFAWPMNLPQLTIVGFISHFYQSPITRVFRGEYVPISYNDRL